METRVAAILLYVVEHLRRGESVHRIRGNLLRKGHSSGEINFALSYLLHATDAHSDVPEEQKFDGPSGIRVLAKAERFALSSEAFGYLLKLRELELITALQMEEIVDEILISMDEVAGVEEVKEVVARFLVERSPIEEFPHVEEETETEH